MDFDLISQYLPSLASGTLLTVSLTIGATMTAIFLGGVAAVSKTSRLRLMRMGAALYIEVVRGTPALVQLFIIYYGLGQAGLALPPFVAAVVALGAFGGAYFAEIFRAGIEGVDRGQTEAAQLLGLSRRHTFWHVIWPQSLAVILPPASSMVIDLMKATALVVTIGAPDLMYAAYNGASATYRAMQFYLVAGLVYLVFAVVISRIFKRLEWRAARHRA